MNFIVEAIGIVAIVLWLYFYPSDPLKQELIGLSIGLSIAVVKQPLLWFKENRQDLKLLLQAFSSKYSKPEIRLSIAYLFRVQCHGKYLLVRNGRDQNHAFQPVGGVYKFYKGECRDTFEKLGIITDTSMSNDHTSSCDLRVKLKHRRKLLSFLKWFRKEENREVDPWREFFEELVKPEIIPSIVFPHIQYNRIGTHMTGIQYSEIFQIDEFLLADIFELLPNSLQEAEFEKLLQTGHQDILWATQKEILSGRKEGNIILPHSKKLFEYQLTNHKY